MSSGDLTYRAAGVDLDAAERAKRAIGPMLDATRDANTPLGAGRLRRAVRLAAGRGRACAGRQRRRGWGPSSRSRLPQAATTRWDRTWSTTASNDILVQGARPLFFLDYLATGKIDDGVVPEIVSGVARACRENGCALLGRRDGRDARLLRPRRVRPGGVCGGDGGARPPDRRRPGRARRPPAGPPGVGPSHQRLYPGSQGRLRADGPPTRRPLPGRGRHRRRRTSAGAPIVPERRRAAAGRRPSQGDGPCDRGRDRRQPSPSAAVGNGRLDRLPVLADPQRIPGPGGGRAA